QQYDFSEPWDGHNNSRLLARMPPVYACPSDTNQAPYHTAYAAVFGEHCVFRGAKPVNIAEITDGTGNTLMVGEASSAGFPWMKPVDVDIEAHPTMGDPVGFGSNHVGGAQFVMADGAVHFISNAINQKTLDALFTTDGNETVGSY